MFTLVNRLRHYFLETKKNELSHHFPLHIGITQGEGMFGSETESTLKDAV